MLHYLRYHFQPEEVKICQYSSSSKLVKSTWRNRSPLTRCCWCRWCWWSWSPPPASPGQSRDSGGRSWAPRPAPGPGPAARTSSVTEEWSPAPRVLEEVSSSSKFWWGAARGVCSDHSERSVKYLDERKQLDYRYISATYSYKKTCFIFFWILWWNK